jgi:hypothetical protein
MAGLLSVYRGQTSAKMVGSMARACTPTTRQPFGPLGDLEVDRDALDFAFVLAAPGPDDLDGRAGAAPRRTRR